MLYHDHAQSLYTSCSGTCTGMLHKNTETDILVYGGNWVSGLLDCYLTVSHISHSFTMAEEEESHKALIEASTKALTSVKVSSTNVLKPPKFDWNSYDQYEDFQLFMMQKVMTLTWNICSTSWVS